MSDAAPSPALGLDLSCHCCRAAAATTAGPDGLLLNAANERSTPNVVARSQGAWIAGAAAISLPGAAEADEELLAAIEHRPPRRRES